jgi:histidine triad (HIT) family protein
VLCQIVVGDDDYTMAYEDDQLLAFMARRPVHLGEVVIFPRQHIDHVTDLPDDLADHLWRVAMRIGRAVREEFEPQRVGFVVHGFGVPHAHLMVVPLERSGDITSRHFVRVEDGDVVIGVSHIPLTPKETLKEAAQRLQSRLVAMATSRSREV